MLAGSGLDNAAGYSDDGGTLRVDPMSLTSRQAIVILSLLGASAFAGTWNVTFLAPVLPRVAHDTGVSVSVAGQLITISALVAFLFLLLLGPLSDRYGRRPMLMLGLAIMSLAALGSALTSSYAALMAMRVLSGLADALVLPAAAAAISDYFRGKDREVALNVLLVPMGAAAVVGLPVVVIVSNILDWHAAFLVFAAFNLVVLIGVRWLLPSAPIAAPAERSLADHYRKSYGEVLGTRTALTILGAAVLGAAVWNGVVTYAGAFFEDELNATGMGLSALFAALGIAYVIGGGIGVLLARRMAPRPIAIWSALAAALLLLPMVASTEVLPVAVALALGFAASRAPGIAALTNMLLDLAPGYQGTAISTYGIIAMSGMLVGASSGGVAIAFEGYTGMASLFTTLALGGALLLILPLGESLAPSEPAPSG